MLGQRLSHYLILEQLGAGGMGVVYRAHDETLNRDVALKVLRTRASGDPASYESLLREARAASSLNHPHICTVHEVREAAGQAFIVMEYIAGQPLSTLIPHDGLPTELVFEYGKQAADALAHAHSKGILHRDLKPANVIVDPAGNVKLLDFGLSQRLKTDELATSTGVTATASYAPGSSALAGTLHYISPEVLKGDLPDPRSDIWALGVVLYEMAAGSPPFHGRSVFELTTSILQDQPAPLPPRIPPGLRAVILRCLAKSPAQRYQQASEVRAALEALQSSADWQNIPMPAPSSRNRWTLPLALGILLLVSAAFLALWTHYEFPGTGLAPGGRLRLLVSSEKTAAEPAISPDGRMIAYIADSQGHNHLFVSRVSGGEHVQLVSSGGGEASPKFSPDGERIAFARLLPDENTTQICTIPTLGGDPVPVIKDAVQPAWSPDGTRLAIDLRRQGESEALATVASDGSDLRILLRGDATLPFFGSPTWSPDGQTIAFVRTPGGISRQLWLIPSRGGAPRQLSHDPYGVYSDAPSFSPDGRGVVHVSNRSGAANIWVAPIDGSPPVRLTSGTGPDSSPTVARDGRIAFLNARSHGVLIVERLDTHELREVYSYAFTLWAPAISPDGRQVAVSQLEADGSWHIWLVSTQGGAGRQLTFGSLPEVYPRFSPDGRFVMFFTYGNQPSRIWRVPTSGGPATPVTPARSESDGYPDISPDGKDVGFSRIEQGVVRLYLMSLDGREAKRLTDLPSTVARWSPDGQWIAYSPARDFSSGIWLMRADGSGVRRVSDTGGWPVWFPDGKRIAFQIVGLAGNTELRSIALAGGAPSTIPGPRFDGINFPFDISRDGRLLVTTNTVPTSDEIWVLEPPPAKETQ